MYHPHGTRFSFSYAEKLPTSLISLVTLPICWIKAAFLLMVLEAQIHCAKQQHRSAV
jgi:hypothetical protein